MEDETREYLGEQWEVVHYGHAVRVLGSDGDPLFLCDSHNAAHFLTPADVAEYVMGLKDEVGRLREALRFYADPNNYTVKFNFKEEIREITPTHHHYRPRARRIATETTARRCAVLVGGEGHLASVILREFGMEGKPAGQESGK